MPNRTIAIVGHGPSLLEHRFGRDIDSADIVVRFKWHQALTEQPERFGQKTDIVCGSNIVAPALPSHWPKVEQFIIFTDSRTPEMELSVSRKLIANHFTSESKNALLDKPLCDYWDHEYRELRGDEDGHDHMSSGMHCLMYIGKYLSGSDVYLYGFDSVLSGIWNWSVTRGPDYENYPDHRFDLERIMLERMTKVYAMNIYDPLQREE